jgi:hypothetical protein
VSEPRRRVLPDPDFFARLDAVLPPNRLASRPSVGDFIAYELETIIDRFAKEWDRLPPAPGGLENARILIGVGRVVSAYAIVGQLRADGWIWLMTITIEDY